MKIRNGFVSNSSSSSFLLVGTKVNISSIKNLNNRYVVIGKSLYEGDDVFEIDNIETLCIVKMFPTNFEVYLAEEYESEPDISSLLDIDEEIVWDLVNEERRDLYEKKYNIYFPRECIIGDVDYCASQTPGDIIDHYELNINEKDIEKEAKKYFREHKLKRINKYE